MQLILRKEALGDVRGQSRHHRLTLHVLYLGLIAVVKRLVLDEVVVHLLEVLHRVEVRLLRHSSCVAVEILIWRETIIKVTLRTAAVIHNFFSYYLMN